MGNLKELLQNLKKDIHLTNVRSKDLQTSLPLINESISFNRGELIILGGRPSMGKSALAFQLALEFSKSNAVVIFSIEMSKMQILIRLLSILSEIPIQDIIKERVNLDHLDPYIHELESRKLYITDKSSLTTAEIKRCIDAMEEKPRVIFIDYLQLMSGFGDNRYAEISNITRDLKLIANDYQLTIIAIAQLNRAVEKREGDKRPLLSDLADSSSIERDADLILFAYRPSRYFKDIDSSQFELNVAKNRTGSTNNIKLLFLETLTKFVSDTPENKEIYL